MSVNDNSLHQQPVPGMAAFQQDVQQQHEDKVQQYQQPIFRVPEPVEIEPFVMHTDKPVKYILEMARQLGLQLEDIDDNVYYFSRSMTPYHPSINYGAANIIQAPALLVVIRDLVPSEECEIKEDKKEF